MGSVIYKPFRDTMYEVGTDGTVRNAKTLQVLKPSPNTYGYLVALRDVLAKAAAMGVR